MPSSTRSSYDALVDVLEAELGVVVRGFDHLTAQQWHAPTHLLPGRGRARCGGGRA
jgi:hypothetical protein